MTKFEVRSSPYTWEGAYSNFRNPRSPHHNEPDPVKEKGIMTLTLSMLVADLVNTKRCANAGQ